MKVLFVGGTGIISTACTELAVARGFVAMASPTVARIRRGDVEKGDVLAAARLAGVMAAKKTPDLVPLCHPIALSGVDVTAEPGPGGVEPHATATRNVVSTTSLPRLRRVIPASYHSGPAARGFHIDKAHGS